MQNLHKIGLGGYIPSMKYGQRIGLFMLFLGFLLIITEVFAYTDMGTCLLYTSDAADE